MLPEEIKEDSLKRKRKYDVRVDSAEKKIRQAIEREYDGAFKERSKMNSSRIHARKLREQIKDDVLARFSNSSDTAERRAAKKIKSEQKRGHSQHVR